MKRALRFFDNRDCMEWFEAEGVPYVVQDDGCVFPESQDAMQIVGTLVTLMRKTGVRLVTGHRVEDAAVLMKDSDAVVVTTGGGAIGLLKSLNIEIVLPVPSLFTFRINDGKLGSLMGTVIDNAVLGIAGQPFRSCGTLLITDWGMSGPAALKLSSYAARYLAEKEYRVPVVVNWTGLSEEEAKGRIACLNAENQGKMICSTTFPGLTSRLWRFLVCRAGIPEGCRWSSIGRKSVNRLLSVLTADEYSMSGRCSFREEFVTCGGVAITEVNLSTLQSKKYPGLYFAGEILDIDAVTGGFNLQAAWSTAMVVARSL